MRDEKCMHSFGWGNLKGRPTPRREDNLRLDLTELIWEIVDWIHVAQDRDQWRALVNTVMNLRVP
jgi:hypothetical protein